DHPREQALDAVHPRSLPAEVIADLQDVQPIAHAGCPRWPTMRAGMPTAIDAAGTSPRTTAPAPMMARSPSVTPSRIFAPAPSHAPAPMVTPADVRPCASTGASGSLKSWSPPIT